MGAGVGVVGAVGFGGAGEELRCRDHQSLRRLRVRRRVVALQGGQRLLRVQEPLAGRRQLGRVLGNGRLEHVGLGGGQLGSGGLLFAELPANVAQFCGCPGELRLRRRPQFLGDLHELLESLGRAEHGGLGGVDVDL